MSVTVVDDNAVFCATLAAALVSAGVRDVVVCPGSRSSPLAIALSARRELTLHIVVDERAAGFLALGLSKARRLLVPVVVTSGSAAAHLFPAVMECHEGNVRGSGGALLALTADRPPELHGCGASQTLDQTRLFGSFAHFLDLGTPAPALLTRVRHEVARAVARGGVTQWNLPFREPLVSTGDVVANVDVVDPVAVSGRAIAHVAADAVLDDVARALDEADVAAVVVGVCDDAEVAAQAARLAAHAGVPLIAELASQARTRNAAVIAHADLLLRHPRQATGAPLWPRADLLVRFGGTPSTRILQAFVDNAARSVAVGRGGGVDPNRSAAHNVDADPAAFAAALAARVTHRPRNSTRRIVHADAAARAALIAHFDDAADAAVDDLAVARAVVASARAGEALVLASSMPIRDAEAVAGVVDDDVFAVGNRGAAGIDGVISTAVGVARGRRTRTTLLIGDLSSLHDLHGLILAGEHGGTPLTIVVVNNDGGGIFSFLGAAAHPRFEQLWGTPHGLSFADAARFARLPYDAPTSMAALREALTMARASGGPALIEVKTDRAHNVAAHQAHFAALHAAIAARLADLEAQ